MLPFADSFSLAQNLHGVVTQVNLCLQEMQETGNFKESVVALKKVIAPFLITSKSEAIRNGLEDRKEQDAKTVKLRRLLESKVESLTRELRDEGGAAGEAGAARVQENKELMEQLNELRVVRDTQKKEILRLKTILRTKGGAGADGMGGGGGMRTSKSMGGLRAGTAGGGGRRESETARSMRLLDEMLINSRQDEEDGRPQTSVSSSRGEY